MLINLKTIRIKKGYTLKQLAAKTGISKTNLNDLENLYRIHPSNTKIDKLLEVLGVTKVELEDENYPKFT